MKIYRREERKARRAGKQRTQTEAILYDIQCIGDGLHSLLEACQAVDLPSSTHPAYTEHSRVFLYL